MTSLVLTMLIVNVFGSAIVCAAETIQPVSMCLANIVYDPADKLPNTLKAW